MVVATRKSRNNGRQVTNAPLVKQATPRQARARHAQRAAAGKRKFTKLKLNKKTSLKKKNASGQGRKAKHDKEAFEALCSRVQDPKLSMPKAVAQVNAANSVTHAKDPKRLCVSTLRKRCVELSGYTWTDLPKFLSLADIEALFEEFLKKKLSSATNKVEEIKQELFEEEQVKVVVRPKSGTCDNEIKQEQEEKAAAQVKEEVLVVADGDLINTPSGSQDNTWV